MTPEEIRKKLQERLKKREEELKMNGVSTQSELQTEIETDESKLPSELPIEETEEKIEEESTTEEEVEEEKVTEPEVSFNEEEFVEKPKPKVIQRRVEKVEVENDEKEVEVGGGLVQVVKEFEEPSEAELFDAMQAVKMEIAPEAVVDYVVTIAGKPVLTYMGILKAAVERGNIEVTVERIERTSRRVVYKAIVRDLEKNVKLEGIGIVDLDIEEEKIKRLKEKYKNEPNRIRNYDEQLARVKEYMEQIAFSRAQRNALKLVIDERYWAHKFKDMIVIRKGKKEKGVM